MDDTEGESMKKSPAFDSGASATCLTRPSLGEKALSSSSMDQTLKVNAESAVVENTSAGKVSSPRSLKKKTFVSDGGDQSSMYFTSSSHDNPDALPVPRLSFDVKQSREGQASDVIRKQRLDKGSPEGKKYMKYQSPGKPDMLHQLLVQRTFSPHEEKFEPLTSSPMRKVRAFADSCGCSPIRSTPSSARSNSNESSHQAGRSIPFVSPRIENVVPSHDMQTIFKTPIRAQHPSGDSNEHSTPSRQTLSLFSSPAGSGSCLFTPGRHFVNPFEMDQERLHMPPFSPSLFHVNSATSSAKKAESEGFWSMEHAALIAPVTIQDSEVQKQCRYQQRRDREQDEKVQAAINAFFSNELIVPSPWSERVNHFLPRTPGSIKSVSCQTTLSVPPGVDLLAELGGKYELPEYKTDSSPPVEAMGNSFIRRKLLNQLNDNDHEIFSSPALPQRVQEKTSSSSLSPSRRQSTPEWEQQTPNKHSSGHFSSSPIHEEPDERGHHPAMSESELLASPELSPVAGSRPDRFSGIYYSDQDMENPRPIMQLDFSSILEDDSDDEEEAGDRLGTLTQQTATENQPSEELSSGPHSSTEPRLQASTNSSQDGEALSATEPSYSRPMLNSGLSVESASDTVSCSTSGPQLALTLSQDTGYHTTSLLQSTTNLAMSTSNSMQIDGAVAALLDPLSWSGKTGSDLALTDFTGLKHRSDLSNDISCLGSSFEGSVKGTSMPPSSDDIGLPRKREPCLVRKIKALSDVRLLREKRNVSRDLTQSFNMDCSAKSDELRRSLCENENIITRSGSRSKLEGLDRVEPLDTSMHSANTSDLGSCLSKITPALLSSSLHEPASSSVQQRSGNNIKESQGKRLPESHDSLFRSKFCLGDDSTLEQARELLGKSEQLRQRHELELAQPDAFHQVLMACDENTDPSWSSAEPEAAVSNRVKHATDVSSPTPRILEKLERNINSVQSSRLGSEIAAEILKRAGDDLAKVTDILEDDPSSPR